MRVRGQSLLKIFCTQLKVGTIGFGGPLATIALMREEFVEKQKQVSPTRFLEGLALVKCLPGPVSTLMALYLGQQGAGRLGGLVSGLGFILPAFIMMLAIVLLESFGAKEFFESALFKNVMQFVQAGVFGVIAWTCFKLWLEAFQRRYQDKREPLAVIFISVLALALSLYRVHELLLLALCAGVGICWAWARDGMGSSSKLSMSPWALFLIFFESGLSVFGTGYMVLPVLHQQLVEKSAVLSEDLFMNALAYGNLTPGPIVIASTYMGAQISGFRGALAATAGIFAAPFLIMTLLGPFLAKIFSQKQAQSLLLGLIPAVAVSIAVSSARLAEGLRWRPAMFAVCVGVFGYQVLKVYRARGP